MKRTDGTAVNVVDIHHGVPVTDCRDRISGAKNHTLDEGVSRVSAYIHSHAHAPVTAADVLVYGIYGRLWYQDVFVISSVAQRTQRENDERSGAKEVGVATCAMMKGFKRKARSKIQHQVKHFALMSQNSIHVATLSRRTQSGYSRCARKEAPSGDYHWFEQAVRASSPEQDQRGKREPEEDREEKERGQNDDAGTREVE
ncbi:hypothetical protein WN55_03207 [Dufourea novaeangliae]|uniref:Uncharacterized protein n=1 Tax=Dufourea novaeangliae TaxID=178035 RepID=A0A154PJT9_DUFNO|nr:hypothetical protein WN55_03207 [Dufourea novaeangliae]